MGYEGKEGGGGEAMVFDIVDARFAIFGEEEVGEGGGGKFLPFFQITAIQRL